MTVISLLYPWHLVCQEGVDEVPWTEGEEPIGTRARNQTPTMRLENKFGLVCE